MRRSGRGRATPPATGCCCASTPTLVGGASRLGRAEEKLLLRMRMPLLSQMQPWAHPGSDSSSTLCPPCLLRAYHGLLQLPVGSGCRLHVNE